MNQNNSQQKIGLPMATIVGMNAMIGAGIFSVPAALALNVGPAGIISYAFVIFAVWFLGTSLARLAQLYPQEGSFYTYAKQWGGHGIGLIAAGSYLIGLVIAMGLLAQVSGGYLHTFFPAISAYTWGAIILSALTILNMLGVIFSEAGQFILICTTVFPLVATTILCFSKANFAHLTPFMPYGFTNIFSATKAVIFGFFGFECAASLFTIVRDPEKNVARALTLAIGLVGILYLLFVTSLILAVPIEHFSVQVPISETLKNIFPDKTWLIYGIHLSILSAVLGTIHSMIWSSSALLFSYFKQLKCPWIKSKLEAHSITQPICVLLIGCAIFVTFLTIRKIELFFSFTAFFIIFSFILSIISLLTNRKEWKSGENIKTLLGLATAFVILYFAIEEIIIHITSS